MPSDYLKLDWKSGDRFLIERGMVRAGGYMTVKGVRYGHGYKYHFKASMRALMPWIDWNRWAQLLIDSFIDYTEIGVMGSASSGKTTCAAFYAYAMFQIFTEKVSIMMSTTTRDGLQLRVFGVVKQIHAKAKERRPWLAGRVIDSRCMLTSSDSDDENQNFLNGILGIACRSGSTWQGIGSYVGVKNDHLILIADEASLMESSFSDSVSNLRKGGRVSWKLVALGNPKDRNDPLGHICEPSASIGGWEGFAWEEKTRTWPTRHPQGLGIQLCGTDSPNYDHPRGLNPHFGLITPEQIELDLAYYGRDSLKFSMMNLGMMPKDGDKRRFITMSLCESHLAFEEVTWGTEKPIRVIGLDAAYSAVGGDRSPLTELGFGKDVFGNEVLAVMEPQITIPTNAKTTLEVQDQLVLFTMAYAEARGIPPDNVGFDSTGRGTLMSAFARLWSTAVVPIEFGGLPTLRPVRAGTDETEKDAYVNQVTALWSASRLVIESKQLRQLSRDCALEGSFREWGIKGAKTFAEPKDETKKRMGRSPDLWDSLVTAIEMARRRGFQIAAGAGQGFRKKTIPQWMIDRQNQVREREKRITLVAV